MTNEPKDNPDKVGYEKARDKILEEEGAFENGTDSEGWYTIYTSDIRKLEALAIAEGERRVYEKIASQVSKNNPTIMGVDFSEIIKQTRQQAFKEVEKAVMELEVKYDREQFKNEVLSILKQAIDQLRNKGE
jgi:hypothetical protein